MRARLRSVAGVMLLSVCVGAPIAEVFDRWDQTARDGNDTEANLVVAAVCIGLGFVAGAALLQMVRPGLNLVCPMPPAGSVERWGSPLPIAPNPNGSPPLVLRV